MKKILKSIRHLFGNIKRFCIKQFTIVDAKRCQRKIFKKIESLKNKKKVKVAFLQMYATSCQNLCIFERMLRSDVYDPYFIVNPDVARSYENLIEQYEKTIKMLTEKYGSERVLLGYNIETKEFTDYSNEFDLMNTNNPYDVMAHKYFKINYWGRKCIPIFYISYFYMGRCPVTAENFTQHHFNYIWKIFVENESAVSIAKEVELIKGKNVILSGYPKMDEYFSLKEEENKKKIVIIAPHHTIYDNGWVSVGSFLETNAIIKELPKLFPQIEFVFRPHPILFETLKRTWKKNEIDSWLKDFLSNGNTSYSTEGNYLQLFKNSSALIHDCGSYMAEYFYTGKPCAFMIKSSLDLDKSLTTFGKECVENHYPLKNEEDFVRFIQDVVIDRKDYKKQERDIFAKQKVMINYPNSTDFIMNNLTIAIRK